jgi:hypothetical protein
MWIFRTRVGVFCVRFFNGRYHALFGDENLGNYATPQQAAEDLAGGYTDWPSCGDPSRFGLPSDIGEWERVR